jgi:hypothetical protein
MADYFFDPMKKAREWFSRYVLRLELFLLLGEILFLQSLDLIGMIIRHRFDQYMPGQPLPVAIEICFKSGCTIYLGCMAVLSGLYLVDCHLQNRKGSFFVIASLAVIFLFLSFYLSALYLALVWRGSSWLTPPFGL